MSYHSTNLLNKGNRALGHVLGIGLPPNTNLVFPYITEGRRIERPSVRMPRGSGPVAYHLAVPSISPLAFYLNRTDIRSLRNYCSTIKLKRHLSPSQELNPVFLITSQAHHLLCFKGVFHFFILTFFSFFCNKKAHPKMGVKILISEYTYPTVPVDGE